MLGVMPLPDEPAAMENAANGVVPNAGLRLDLVELGNDKTRSRRFVARGAYRGCAGASLAIGAGKHRDRAAVPSAGRAGYLLCRRKRGHARTALVEQKTDEATDQREHRPGRKTKPDRQIKGFWSLSPWHKPRKTWVERDMLGY